MFYVFQLSLFLPEAPTVISTIERLNDLCQYMTIKAKAVDHRKTCLTFGAETESIAVKTKFTDLELNVTTDDSDSKDNVTTNWVSVRVSVKKINVIFNTLKHLKPNSITCNISHKNKIYFQFFHNFANFQAILPNVDI